MTRAKRPRGFSLAVLALALFALAFARPAAAIDCFAHFAAVLKTSRRVVAATAEVTYDRLAAVWKEALVPAGHELSAAARAEVDAARAAIRGKREEFAAAPWRTTGRAARDTALYVPRLTGALAVDLYRLGQRWGRDTFAPNQSPFVRIRRQFVMKRDRPGETSFGDFLRDPITFLSQLRVVRETGGRLLGRSGPLPAFEWTVAEIPSLVIVGGAMGYGVDKLFTERTDELNRREIEKLRPIAPLGFRAFDAWYRLGQFESQSGAHRAFKNHVAMLVRWRTGETGILPASLDLLAGGVFGDLSEAELDRVRDVAKRMGKGLTAVKFTSLAAILNESERSALQALLEFDFWMRKNTGEAVKAHLELQRKLERNELAAGDFVERDDFVQRFLREALERDPAFGKEAGYPADKRILLGRALNPRIEIEGKSGLLWLALARAAAIGKGDPKHRSALAAAWQAFRDMDAESGGAPQAEVLGARLAAEAQTANERAERERQAEARATGEVEAAAKALAETQAIIGRERAFAATDFAARRRAEFYTQRANREKSRLALAEHRAREAMAARERVDIAFAKQGRARAIDGFCASPDCSDRKQTLDRPDLPFLRRDLKYFAGGNERALASEMDRWQLMFDDLRFLDFGVRKHRGDESDAALLRDFDETVEARDWLNREQAALYAAAVAAGAKDWRTDDSLEIPKPPFATFCALLGHGKKGARSKPHRLFRAVSLALTGMEKKLERREYLACRASLSRLVWDYHAFESEIANSLPAIVGREAKNAARVRMLEFSNEGRSALTQTIDACLNRKIGLFEPAEEAAIDCESN